MDKQKRIPLKVTVLRVMKTEDVFDKPIPEQVSHAPNCCARLKEGQVFIIDENGECSPAHGHGMIFSPSSQLCRQADILL